MPPYVIKAIRRRARLFVVAAVLGGMAAAAVWKWGVRAPVPDPFAQAYSQAELDDRLQRGASVFAEQNCAECHATAPAPADDAASGVGLKGPPLVGIVGRNVTLESGRIVARDHRYLRRSIRDSRSDIVKGYAFQVMPDYSFLEGEDVDALLLYIRSLGEDQAAQAADSP